MRRILLIASAGVVVALAIGWVLVTQRPRWFGPTGTAAATPAAATADQPSRKIQASLFYVSEDGAHLIAVPRDIPFAEETADQARSLVEEQLKPAPAPYAQALPLGTSVRAVYLTDRNEAFVDLSAEVTTGHTGGSLDELFAVYAIVNAITVNLPAIERVQILVNGNEVDSLAGHVDLRRPLPRNLSWVSAGPAPATPSVPDATKAGGPPVS